ncbi:EF-hand domain-containing protein [Arenibacterium sp. CAU 1754]
MRFSILVSALMIAASPALAQGQGVPGAHFIENWDLDGNGEVSADEVAEKRSDIFYMFDQDENGTLTSSEYDLFDETRRADMANNGGGLKGPMKTVDTAMDRAFNDLDDDGSVTQDEFASKSADFFGMLDRNKDGRISTEDFGPRG